MIEWMRHKVAGGKTYGVVWSAVLVLFVDAVGWYDVPGLEVTAQALVGAVLAALAVTFGKAGITREIRALAPTEATGSPPEA